MTISKHYTISLLAVIASCSTQLFGATTIELKNGDTLSGKVSTFNEGSLTLVSPVASEPLQINGKAIQRILFNKQPEAPKLHSEKLTLVNGDTIPCRVLSLDAKQLKFATHYAGDFTIERELISNIQFGIDNQRVIYNGKDEISKWSTTGSWAKPDKDTFTSKGSGTISRKLELPENLRISYTLIWRSSPNFVFRFCGEKSSATTRQDTYEYTFNRAGMQIRRYQGNNNIAAPLVNIPLKPEDYNGRSINLDFHINRKDGNITLFVDSKKIGTWPDQFDISKGNYIIFNNRSSKNQITIKNILISDLNDGSLPRYHQTLQKAKADTFLDSDGNIRSGNILNITTAESKKRTMVMEEEFNTKPFSVPEHRISSMRFSHKDDPPQFPKPDFNAILHHNGQIQLSNPEFLDGFVAAEHPILGKCKIDIKALSQLRKHSSEKSE